MKYAIVLLFICSIFINAYGKKITVFPELNKPNNFILDGDHLFISDCPSVYIYSFRNGNIQLIKKFGKEGNGPGEFKRVLASFFVTVQPEYVFVNARNKIAYFTRKGEFIREKNTGALGYSFLALNDKIFGRKVVFEKKWYMTIKMFDSNLKELSELTRQLHVRQPDTMKIKAYTTPFNITTGGNKIFISDSIDYIFIKVFDYQGRLLYNFDEKERIKRIKIENKHKEDFHNYMNIVLPEYQSLKENVVFPEYFPSIRGGGLKYDNDRGGEKIYIVTWEKRNSNHMCFMFDAKGKFIKKVFLPIKEENAIQFFPFQIKDGKIYQLIENANDDWELHMIPIK